MMTMVATLQFPLPTCSSAYTSDYHHQHNDENMVTMVAILLFLLPTCSNTYSGDYCHGAMTGTALPTAFTTNSSSAMPTASSSMVQ